MRPRKDLSMLYSYIVQLVTTSRRYEYHGGPSYGWSLIRAVTDARCSAVCNFLFEGRGVFSNIQQFEALPTQCIYGFCRLLRINTYLFTIGF